ncbi:prolactin-releasing peptide receptor [Lepeophtheirus salmonis]|uniref:prolactin-releasing peptide receptor n=1 Tax=Lepeophtheirus salmonis TaxID=72036 RepID=UPI001AE7118A|nr:prolactin-releasing peptide receptor-like [Lepeophtheirus salmonis]
MTTNVDESSNISIPLEEMNDTNLQGCSNEQQLIKFLGVQLIFSFFYLIIFVLGISGNLLVVIAILRKRAMRDIVTNLFILNLAISDIVMCLFAVPFTPLQTFTGVWYFGEALCILFPFSQGVSVYISTLTLTIIAVDRFVVIIYPFRARMRVKTCICLILIIDILAGIFTAPYAVHISIVTYGSLDRCQENWDGMKRALYGAFTNITQFVLPFISIILCYTAIIRRLSHRTANRPGLRSAQKEEQERARNLRTNRMLISMVIVFGTCWLPLNTINFIGDLNYDLYCWGYHHFSFFICHVMAMSSTVYNPFLYGWYNESFQKEFVKILPILKGICPNENHDDPKRIMEIQKRVVTTVFIDQKQIHVNGSQRNEIPKNEENAELVHHETDGL